MPRPRDGDARPRSRTLEPGAPLVTAAGPTRDAFGRLSEVAVYQRTVYASLERIWENVLDWEHLPWLHRSSFLDVHLRAARRDGWRARIALPPREAPQEADIDVQLERPRLRYLTRTIAGAGAGTEILTRLEPVTPHTTAITVTFRVPGVGRVDAAAIGGAYVRIYTRLWDEDEAMMRRRQALLDTPSSDGARQPHPVEPVRLGSVERLRAQLPIVIEAHGRTVRLVAIDGRILAHDTVCPHLGGPLDAAPIEDGCVRCPWHGYRFDVRTGANTDGRACRLAPAVAIDVDADTGEASLRPPAAGTGGKASADAAETNAEAFDPRPTGRP